MFPIIEAGQSEDGNSGAATGASSPAGGPAGAGVSGAGRCGIGDDGGAGTPPLPGSIASVAGAGSSAAVLDVGSWPIVEEDVA